MPLVTSVPGGSDVSIVSVNATIGPSGLTYYKQVHGKLKPFHPLGIGVPKHCPHGGFPFSASFVFHDGSQTSASKPSLPTARAPAAQVATATIRANLK